MIAGLPVGDIYRESISVWFALAAMAAILVFIWFEWGRK